MLSSSIAPPAVNGVTSAVAQPRIQSIFVIMLLASYKESNRLEAGYCPPVPVAIEGRAVARSKHWHDLSLSHRKLPRIRRRLCARQPSAPPTMLRPQSLRGRAQRAPV